MTSSSAAKIALEDFRTPTEHAKVNQFGIRCFRDTGVSGFQKARNFGFCARFLMRYEMIHDRLPARFD